MELDQVDEDRPLNLQEKVLLVLLKLGMEPVDHALARRLGAKLAVKRRLQQVEPPAQVFGHLFDRGNYVRFAAGSRWLLQGLEHGLTGGVGDQRIGAEWT